MKLYEYSYIDSLITQMTIAIKQLNETKEYCDLVKYGLTSTWIDEAQNNIKNAIGTIQSESESRNINAHQELK